MFSNGLGQPVACPKEGVATHLLRTAALNHKCYERGIEFLSLLCKKLLFPTGMASHWRVGGSQGQTLVHELQIYRATSCFPKHSVWKALHGQRLGGTSHQTGLAIPQEGSTLRPTPKHNDSKDLGGGERLFHLTSPKHCTRMAPGWARVKRLDG